MVEKVAYLPLRIASGVLSIAGWYRFTVKSITPQLTHSLTNLEASGTLMDYSAIFL